MHNSAFEDIAIEASKLLNDSYDCNPEYNFTRWTQSDLAHYAKDAVNMMFMLYPQKFTDCKVVTLSKGRVQKLPDNCVKLIKVLGVKDDSRVNSSITSATNERLGELFQSGCSESLNPSDYEVKGYSLEPASDNIFYIDPPAPVAGIEVNVICACAPDTNDINYAPESWMHNPLIEWVLYRAYSSEDESAQAANMASMHLQHFYTILENYVSVSQGLTAEASNPSLGGRPSS